MRTYFVFYTPEKLEFIKANQYELSRKELTRKFNDEFGVNKTVAAIRNICLRNNFITKPRSGKLGWFKKGSTPKNCKPIGSERKSTRCRGISVKININEWRIKSHIEWEKHNEPLKKSEVIAYLDGNKENSDYSNLRKVTKKELLWMNKQKLSDLSVIEKNILISCAKLNSIKV